MSFIDTGMHASPDMSPNTCGDAFLISALNLSFNLRIRGHAVSKRLLGGKDEANQALEAIKATDYLTVWNTVLSRSSDPGQEDASTATAAEVLWRTRDTYAGGFNDAVAEEVFALELNTPSGVMEATGADGTPEYVIIMVSGRETRDLAESELQNRKQQLLRDYLDERSLEAETNELWRSHVPTVPLLDPKFRQPPTPTPDAGVDGAGATDNGGVETP